jgi:integrase
MAKRKQHKPLTAQGVERMKPPAKGPNDEAAQVDIPDGGHPGLVLRVGSGGTKAWCYFCRWQGKQLRLRLGVYPTMSLAEARDAWRACRTAKDEGLDPASAIERPTQAAEAVEAPAADLFETVLARWLAEAHDDSKPKTRTAIERMFSYNVQGRRPGTPNWNGRRLADITPEDVEKAVYGIANRGKLTMSRRFQTFLDLFFRWAVGVRKIKTNPVEGLPMRGSEVSRDRVLLVEKADGSVDYTEIALMWRAADAETKISPMGEIAKLLLLTGCREMEIGALRWNEIHGNAIMLEGERTKNGKQHVVPLSPQAKAILDGVPRISGCPYVFTVTGEGPYTSWSCSKRRLDDFMRTYAIENDIPYVARPWRIHDLRRTAATVLEHLDTPLQVTEAVLNHVSGSKRGLVGRYQRAKYEAKKRQAVEALANEIERIVGGNVIPMRRVA